MIKTLYDRRKELREHLNQSRIRDRKSHCQIRLAEDAKKLDSPLIAEGYTLDKKTLWGETDSEKRRRMLRVQSDLNLEVTYDPSI